MRGDPHITTLDARVYTFNGWGEYTLMRMDTEESSFLLQGRTQPVVNASATQFAAFAFGVPNVSVVEVRAFILRCKTAIIQYQIFSKPWTEPMYMM